MSHEIRTPMNGILGFANLLKEPQLDGEDQKKYVEIIEKSGERMLSTINNIIDISKIEAGQIEVVNKEFYVSEKLDNLLQFFKPEADKKGIQLVVQNKLSKPEVKIKSDQEKITAIFTNLIKNALKFCDKGKIEFGCNRTGNFLEFYVKDTGKGIPPDRKEAIFERFIQADIEDKAANEGSGLGLTISKSYAELLGGKIWVESEKEKGSKFTFTIPFVPVTIPQTTYPTNSSSSESKIRKLNILIVEDDSVSETLLKIMIDKIGKQIFSTKTGLDAVEICRQNPDIDLILMDIKMPFMNGYETTKKIREFNKNVKIIATTAFALAGDQEKALNSGCNGYLTKPIMRDRLNDLIAHHFS
jgi:CheY-like chemotaxis protein/two-component sensor histidine kinase